VGPSLVFRVSRLERVPDAGVAWQPGRCGLREERALKGVPQGRAAPAAGSAEEESKAHLGAAGKRAKGEGCTALRPNVPYTGCIGQAPGEH